MTDTINIIAIIIIIGIVAWGLSGLALKWEYKRHMKRQKKFNEEYKISGRKGYK